MSSDEFGFGNIFSNRPTPDNFEKFIPWACGQLQVPDYIKVVSAKSEHEKKHVASGKKPHTKDKANQVTSKTLLSGSQQKAKKSISDNDLMYDEDAECIKITAVYDLQGNLIHIKFDKNKHIPRLLFKVIELVLNYHVHLNSITINKGIDYTIIHELTHFLKHTITTLCLDSTCVLGGNYDILLENKSQLKNLSLARCNIDDKVAMRIADKLAYPLPASETLSVLNLATNRMSDKGAEYLAGALRSNRCLVYLNLSDNGIEDDGFVAILKSLEAFRLTDDETSQTRHCFMKHLRNKMILVSQDKVDEDKKLPVKRKFTKTLGSIRKKSEKIEKEDDDFMHPFSRLHTYTLHNQIYCCGNNQLAYLNVSYNNITYTSMKNLLSVVTNQNLLNRKPKGLVRVVIDGNNIPDFCEEIDEIETLLRSGYPESKIKKKTSRHVT